MLAEGLTDLNWNSDLYKEKSVWLNLAWHHLNIIRMMCDDWRPRACLTCMHTQKPLQGFLSLFKRNEFSHLDRLLLTVWTLAVSQSGLVFPPLHNLCSCRRLCAALVFQPDLRCGICKGQIILWELFCLKPLVQPKQTEGDKRERSGLGLGPRRHVVSIRLLFLTAPFSCRGEDLAHLVWIASHIIMEAG